MKKIVDLKYHNSYVRFFYGNYKKLFKPNDYIELSSYDYNGNYPIWSSYDYFIYKAITTKKLNSDLFTELNKLKAEKDYFNDYKLIKKINNKYKEIINFIEANTNLVYGLDYVE